MEDRNVITVTPGRILRRFSADETAPVVAEWLEVYGRNRKGIDTKSYLWHIFSGDRYPCMKGHEALEQYSKQTGAEFIVLSNDRVSALVTDHLPESSSLSDYYVFPRNLAWTMAFTHEDGWLGPWFALHPDFRQLNRENQSELLKRAQASQARQNGWS